MKQTRLDRLNPDKTPKHQRKDLSGKEFFEYLLEEKECNARLYGEYIEFAENLSARGLVLTIDATDTSFDSEKFLIENFDKKNDCVYPLAILIYHIRHIPPQEQAARFESMLKREPSYIIGNEQSPIVPDEVPVFIMEDVAGHYPLAREIIQNAGFWGQSKCYIFISHSRKDIAKVRLVRNHLEDHGFEPLLFYLRCMDNEGEDTEKLRELIYKEIDSREWFLYLDSINSRSSDWVKAEVEYIETSKDHVIKKLCIDSLSEDELIESINDLIRNLSVFISYSREDNELAKLFYEEFCSHGLKVFYDEKELLPGKSMMTQMNHAVEYVSRNGGIVFLMTKNSLQSEYVRTELRRAISLNRKVYPVYLNKELDIDIESEIHSFIGNMQYIKCQPNAESIRDCVLTIIRDIRNRIIG
jgi:hypothetical protein